MNWLNWRCNCVVGRLLPIDTIEEIRSRKREAKLLLGRRDKLPTRKSGTASRVKTGSFIVLDAAGTPPSPYPIVHRKIDISATEIRKRVASGQSIRYFVPQAVEEIIRREEIYQEQAK